MPAHEYDNWLKYLDWKSKESKKAQKKTGKNNKKVVQTNTY